jgi:hypothetical protein
MEQTGLILYSTDHCSLCETALDMLLSMPDLQGLALNVVDIASDDHLVKRYGELLPVLCVGSRELVWPFTPENVLTFVTHRA